MQSCGRVFCPILARAEAILKVGRRISKDNFVGSSPTVFIGHNFYPKLYVGILSPPEHRDDAWIYDAPHCWVEQNLTIPTILDYRSSLINSRFRADIKGKNRFLDISREVGMASKPVDIEIELKEKPKFRLKTDAYLAPTGPNARLKKAKLVENPRVDSRIEKVVSDIDLVANQALVYLYKHGFNENFLTKLLSTGNLGIKANRKLVPTRWSITATDDSISKYLLGKVRDYDFCGYEAYFGGHLGNYFIVLFFPDVWSYELFEMYSPGAEWNLSNQYKYMTDYESYYGRKGYAENCGGGYYAARFAVLEKLFRKKRQASVLVFRFITGEYAVPLGVWVVREAVRKTLRNKPIEFSSEDLMLQYARKLVKKKFDYKLDILLRRSVILKKSKNQMRLRDFLG